MSINDSLFICSAVALAIGIIAVGLVVYPLMYAYKGGK